MKSKTLIICDLSDVLVKGLEGSEALVAKHLGQSVEEVSQKMFTYDYTPLWYGHMTEEEFFLKILKDFDWNISVATLRSAIYANFYEIKGTKLLYEKLSSQHMLVLYSVNCPEWVLAIKNIVNYEDLFDQEFYSYDLKAHKKEPKGFEEIMKRYPNRPYYLIDDSLSNIGMAEKLGIKGIHFSSATQLEIDLKERGLL